MADINFINQHQQLLRQLLDGRKELRREMVSYLTALDEVWNKMPTELTAEDRVLLLREITAKFMDELLYSMSMLDKRFDELLAEYKNIDQAKAQDSIKSLSAELEGKESSLYEARLKLEDLERKITGREAELLAQNTYIEKLHSDIAQSLEDAQKQYETQIVILEREKDQALEKARYDRNILIYVQEQLGEAIGRKGGLISKKIPAEIISDILKKLNDAM